MAEVQVDLVLDAASFMAAMRRAAEQSARAVQRFAEAFLSSKAQHYAKHHRVEVPERSAMHAAYDRRRRARRRR